MITSFKLFESLSKLKARNDDFEIELNKDYFLYFWVDEDDNDSWNLSLINTGDEDHETQITFAVEDTKTKKIEITRAGLFGGQYLSDHQMETLKTIDIIHGQVYKNIEELFKHIEKNLKIYYQNAKLKPAFKVGILEKYVIKDEEDYREVYGRFKEEVNYKICKHIADSLTAAGFNVEMDKDMYYNLTVNTIPMQIVNNYELAFDNDRIYGLTNRGATRYQDEIPNDKSFATENPEVFKFLQREGVDSGIGGPKYRNPAALIKQFFEYYNVDFYLKPLVKKAGKTGLWDGDVK